MISKSVQPRLTTGLPFSQRPLDRMGLLTLIIDPQEGQWSGRKFPPGEANKGSILKRQSVALAVSSVAPRMKGLVLRTLASQLCSNNAPVVYAALAAGG